MKLRLLLIALFPALLIGQEIFQKELIFPDRLGVGSIVPLPGGDYLACGSTVNATLDSSRAILLRFDSLMQVVWCKSYNFQARDNFFCMAPLSDGNYIVGGNSKSQFSNDVGSTLFKVDASGNVIWSKLYSGNYDDVSYGIYEQSDQSIVVIVRHGVTGQPAKILKTDDSGNLLNDYNLSTTNNPAGVLPDCVTGDGNGNYYLGGNALNTNTGKYMYYIAKITDNDVVWYKEYDPGRSSAYLYGITVLSDGNIAATGSLANDENPNIYSAGLLKINAATGSPIWVKEIKQTEDYFVGGYGINALADNKMMILGRANSAGGVQGYAAKLDADGNIEWVREYGDGVYESMGDAMEITGNRYLILGRMALDANTYFVQTDFYGITPCFSSLMDFVTVDLTADMYSPATLLNDPVLEELSPPLTMADLSPGLEVICSGTVGLETFQKSTDVKVYPIPSFGTLMIELLDHVVLPCRVEIFDGTGNRQFSTRLDTYHKTLNPGLNPGLYLIIVTGAGENILDRKKILIL